MPEMIDARIIAGHRIYDVREDDGSITQYPSVTTMLKALPEPEGLKWFRQNFENPE
jgi:hypothetical protein